MSLTPPRIGISLGDPTGVGPEVVVAALAARPGYCARIFGDLGVLSRAQNKLGLRLGPEVEIEEVTQLSSQECVPGRPSRATGAAQVAYLKAAVAAASAGRIAGLATAPISKEGARQAGFPFPGHTEYLAAATGTGAFAMMLAGPRLRVTVCTTHVALAAVPRLLSVAGIASSIVLTARELLGGFAVRRPRVAVAALNPHAGEGGLFGDEEARLIVPAIDRARVRLAELGIGAELSGPHVPDVVFRQAADGAFDAVVAMYHDQGLIPLKLLHFDEGVNVTLGLPFPRTSPDHGTAYDIAGTGKARPVSMGAALDLVAFLAKKHVGGDPPRLNPND